MAKILESSTFSNFDNTLSLFKLIDKYFPFKDHQARAFSSHVPKKGQLFRIQDEYKDAKIDGSLSEFGYISRKLFHDWSHSQIALDFEFWVANQPRHADKLEEIGDRLVMIRREVSILDLETEFLTLIARGINDRILEEKLTIPANRCVQPKAAKKSSRKDEALKWLRDMIIYKHPDKIIEFIKGECTRAKPQKVALTLIALEKRHTKLTISLNTKRTHEILTAICGYIGTRSALNIQKTEIGSNPILKQERAALENNLATEFP